MAGTDDGPGSVPGQAFGKHWWCEDALYFFARPSICLSTNPSSCSTDFWASLSARLIGPEHFMVTKAGPSFPSRSTNTALDVAQ